MHIGYCGNVHPGRTLQEVKQNLTKYSLDVKSQIRPQQSMGIGLWLSATAAKELEEPTILTEFRDWLAESGLVPFTLNGFPYGDFHQNVVKHDVYRPTWAQSERLDYTIRLAEILNVLLPEPVAGTISTLPLGWPTDSGKSNVDDESFWKACATNLQTCARHLDRLAQSTGRRTVVCIEPEPGCILDTCEDIVQFFEQHLTTSDPQSNEMIRNHIGVCHDICHSAVMFEEQVRAVQQYQRSGIRIGKVQVSSAVEVEFDRHSDSERSAMLEQLRGFAEPKYLHQTSTRIAGQHEFFEDLGLALEHHQQPAGMWRVHFHVPIFSQSLGNIGTTQSDIKACVDAIQSSGEPMPHWEVETYAWNVLPQSLRHDSLADGIAKEILWFDELLANYDEPDNNGSSMLNAV